MPGGSTPRLRDVPPRFHLRRKDKPPASAAPGSTRFPVSTKGAVAAHRFDRPLTTEMDDRR
jgi:hypothetical protein